jgi:hypothetical protein
VLTVTDPISPYFNNGTDEVRTPIEATSSHTSTPRASHFPPAQMAQMDDAADGSLPVPELIPDIYPVAARGRAPPSILGVREELPPRPFSTPPRINSRGDPATSVKMCVALSLFGQSCRCTHTMLITIGIVHERVHSDVALNLATLCHRLFCVFVFVFVLQALLDHWGYNQPKVFGTVFVFPSGALFFPTYDYTVCSTFWVSLPIRGSLDVNRERKGARDAIVTVPLSCFSPYYACLPLMCASCTVCVDKSVATRTHELIKENWFLRRGS